MPFEKQLMDLAFEPMLAWHIGGQITFWNAGCEHLYGYTAQEAIGTPRDVVLGGHPLTDAVMALLSSQGHWSGERAHLSKYGQRHLVDCRLQLLSPDQTILEVHRDITTKRQAAEVLDRAESRFGSFSALSSNWYWELDESLHLTSTTDNAVQLIGSKDAFRIGKTLWDRPSIDANDAAWIDHRAHLARHDPFRNFEYPIFDDHREVAWIQISADPVFDTNGRFTGYRGAGRNITQRKRNEDLLSKSNERLEVEVLQRTRQLEAMYDAAINAILTIDPRGIIQSINTATTRLLGYAREDLIGSNVRMIMPEPYAGHHDGYLEAYLTTGKKKIIGIGREVLARRKDGTTFPIHLSVSEFEVNDRHYFTGIITDLTERREAELALRNTEHQLAQAQKMEAVGQLTGGLAHDFNNLLTVISGNLELLDMRIEGEPERDLIRRADAAARMGARLTGRLLTFSSRRALQPTIVNLNDTTVGMTELLRRTLGESISVTSELAPDLWNTSVDASEIENAILNLAINARDAMPNGGRILIETANISLEEDDPGQSPASPPGDYVKLSVSDNGTGMPPEVVARAFEPFYTTKDPGRGTGLGLSTIYGFIRQSDGRAAIYSEVGRGTTVSLYLLRDASSGVLRNPVKEPDATPTRTGETILVVEDNEQVRHLTVQRLDALGYDILIAEDGPSALRFLEQETNINLVFSDVVMPGGLSGFDVLRWTKQNRPEVKVLLTSGFAPEMANNGEAIDPDTKLLHKPYTIAELARAIREAFRS